MTAPAAPPRAAARMASRVVEPDLRGVALARSVVPVGAEALEGAGAPEGPRGVALDAQEYKAVIAIASSAYRVAIIIAPSLLRSFGMPHRVRVPRRAYRRSFPTVNVARRTSTRPSIHHANENDALKIHIERSRRISQAGTPFYHDRDPVISGSLIIGDGVDYCRGVDRYCLNHPCISFHHTCALAGLRIQWPSSGNSTNRLGTP